MDIVTQTLGSLQSFVASHQTDAILASVGLSLMALLLSLWSLLRRRGVRRLRRQVRHLEQRLRRLELSGERHQVVTAIGMPDRGAERA